LKQRLDNIIITRCTTSPNKIPAIHYKHEDFENSKKNYTKRTFHQTTSAPYKTANWLASHEWRNSWIELCYLIEYM